MNTSPLELLHFVRLEARRLAETTVGIICSPPSPVMVCIKIKVFVFMRFNFRIRIHTYYAGIQLRIDIGYIFLLIPGSPFVLIRQVKIKGGRDDQAKYFSCVT